MKTFEVRTWDDLEAAEDRRVPADQTAVLSLNGFEVELDLTTEHHDELVKFLQPYLEAGAKTGPVKPSKNPRIAAAVRAARTPESQGYFGGLRAYSDSKGYQNREHNGPAYNSPAGQRNYPKWLRREYDALPQEQRDKFEADYLEANAKRNKKLRGRYREQSRRGVHGHLPGPPQALRAEGRERADRAYFCG